MLLMLYLHLATADERLTCADAGAFMRDFDTRARTSVACLIASAASAMPLSISRHAALAHIAAAGRIA